MLNFEIRMMKAPAFLNYNCPAKFRLDYGPHRGQISVENNFVGFAVPSGTEY